MTTQPLEYKALPEYPVLPLAIYSQKEADGTVIYGYTLGGNTARGPAATLYMPGYSAINIGPGNGADHERIDLTLIGSLFEVVPAKVTDKAPYYCRLRPGITDLFRFGDTAIDILQALAQRDLPSFEAPGSGDACRVEEQPVTTVNVPETVKGPETSIREKPVYAVYPRPVGRPPGSK